MAENKKGFILYADQKELFDQLPNEKAGELIKHIFAYVNDEEPVTNDLLIKVSFTPIKQQLKRDLKKFEATKLQRSEAGKRSAEVRKAQRDATSVNTVQRSSTKATVTVNDNVTVKVINKEEDFKKSLSAYLDVFGKTVLNEFYSYWTEKNDNGKKMRFEYAKNQPFNIERRLVTWSNRQSTFTPKQNGGRL